MAGAGGQEVGRVSIKVVPDLAEFRAKLDAMLAFYEGRELHINVVADNLKEFRASVEQAADGITAEVATEAKTAGVREKIKAAVSGVTAEVDVDVDDKGSLDRFQRRALARLNSAFSKIEVKLDLTDDGEYQRRMYEAAEKTLRKSAEMGVPKLVEDAALFRQTIEAAVKKAEDLNTSMQDPFDLEKTIAARKKFETKVDRIRADTERAGSAQRVRERQARDAEAAEILASRQAFEAKIERIRDEAQRLGSAKRLADRRAEQASEQADAAKHVKDIMALYDRRNALNAEFKIAEDLANFEKTLAAYVNNDGVDVAIRAFLDENSFSSVNTKIKDRLNGSFSQASSAINRDAGRFSRGIAVSLGAISAAGIVAGGGLVKGLNNISAALGDTADKAASALSGFRAFGIGLIPILLLATLLPPAFALVAGAITVIPAIVAGLLVPIGAVLLGLDGIKAAAKAAEPAFKSLREVMAGVFERGMTPGFQKLNDIVIPQLTEQFKSVGDAMSNAFTGVVDVLAEDAGMNNLQKIIQNIGTAINNAVPGLKNFTSGLLELTGKLSEKFPGLAEAFNRTGASFLGWVDKITTKDPVTQVSQLDSAMKNLGDTLSPIGGIISDIFNDGFDNLSDNTFADSMQSFVDSTRTLVNETLPALATGFETLAATLEPVVATVEALGDAWQFVMPESSSGGIPDWVPLLGSWDNLLADWFGDGTSAELSTQEGIKLAQALREGMTSGMGAGILEGAFQGADLIPPDIGAAVAAQISEGITNSAADQKQALLSVFTAGGVDTAVSGQLTQQVTAAVDGARQAMVGLGPELQAQIDTALIPLGTIAGLIGNAFTTVQTNVSTSMGGVVTAVTDKMNSIPEIVRGALTQVPEITSTAFTPIAENITTAMTAATEAVVTGVATIVVEVQGIKDKVSGAVGDLSTTLTPAGNQLAAGLGAGLKAGMDDVLAYASGIAAQIAAVKGPLPKDRTELIPAGEALMDGLGTGLDSGFQSVLERTKAMAKAIFEAMKEVFGSAAGANFNFNLGGAESSMSNIASSAQGFSQNMGSALAPVKPGKLSDVAKGEIDALKKQSAGLDVEIALLRERKYSTDKAGKAALDAQIAELNARKANTTATIKQMEYDGKYGEGAQANNDEWTSILQKSGQGMVGLGQSVLSTHAQDLGISGNGALSTIAQTGLDWGSQFVFNVSNMDDALAAQKMQTDKQSLQY